MRFEIVTIFPEFFTSFFENGILRRALAEELVTVGVHDLRAFTHDRHRTVDDRPFGGGEGMVLKAGPLAEAMASLGIQTKAERHASNAVQAASAPPQVVLLSAQGRPFTQAMARELATEERVVLICGRYEGVDERISEFLADRELSVGDYVLSGGELAAAIIVDVVTRLLPGALGNEASAWQESFSPAGKAVSGEHLPDSTCAWGGLLDYPHYTRPAEYRGMPVPEVLLGGNHEEIRRWRRRRALEKTLHNRPELLRSVPLNDEDRKLLAALGHQES